MFATSIAHRPAPAAPNAHRILRLASRTALGTVWGAVWLLAAARPGSAQVGSEPVVAPASQPAAGRHVARLTVPIFGRYSLAVKSQQGVSLDLVDRMAGALGTDGDAGTADGRLDRFLDRGEYLVIIRGSEHAKGTAALTVAASVELSATPGPVLAERKEIAAVLDDHQQVSWWVRIPKSRPVFFEAAGRSLADLRIWREGTWLEGAMPRCTGRQPVVGQPLVDCQLAATLGEGLYRVSAYGGAPQAWASGEDSHPLFLRWGVPELPASGRRRFLVSPFGVDRFLAPPSTNFVRIELAESGAAGLRVGYALPSDPFFRIAKVSAEITKKSRPWVAQVDVPEATVEDRSAEDPEGSGAMATDVSADESGSDESATAEEGSDENGDAAEASDDSSDGSDGNGEEASSTSDESSDQREQPADNSPVSRWIEVSGTPGQAYVLQHFEYRAVYGFQRTGSYWLSTVQTGSATDEADATGALISPRVADGRVRDEVVALAAMPLDVEHAYTRRFNLLDDVSLFFQVTEAGSYQVSARSAGKPLAARFVLEPFFTNPPRDYKTPAARASGDSWALSPGLWVLRIHPDGNEKSRGIVDLTVAAVGAPASSTLSAAATAHRGEARFGRVDLTAARDYTVVTGVRPDVRVGLILRPWPLDLAQALPLTLVPGESLVLEGRAPAAGSLRVEAEDGTLLPIAVDGGAPETDRRIAAGAHSISIPAPSSATSTSRSASLVFTEERLSTSTPDEPLPQGELAALPQFPKLSTGELAHLDLETRGSATYLVQVDSPALYQVASTGLLATSAVMRTRTIPELTTAAGNGVGRNFELASYLGAGDYQLGVATEGSSAGHLGLTLRKTALLDGGELRAGSTGRASLEAGQGVAFRFTIGAAGRYRITGAGDGFTYLCRLEDADGWPIAQPTAPANMTLELRPGSYRLLLLPRTTPSKALARFAVVETPIVGTGHGPQALRPGIAVAHVWQEPQAGAERESDVYTFHLAAPATLSVLIDGEMQGQLRRQAEGTAPVGTPQLVPPGRGFKGALLAGDYQLAVECSRRNNLVPYRVLISTDELVAGTDRALDAPGEIPVSVGESGMTEIASESPAAVRGVLLDEDGNVVAQAGTRPDDWNFLFSRHVPAGRYRLRVDPVGARTLHLRVAMRSRDEVDEQTAVLPLERTFDPSASVHLIPLEIARGGDLVVVALDSIENVGCILEHQEADSWRAVSSAIGRSIRVAAALDAVPGAWRVRLWSLDGRGEPLRLRAAAVAPHLSREEALRGGIVLAPMRGLASWGAAAVELTRIGVLSVHSGASLLQAGGPGQAFESSGDGQLVALARRVFWIGEVGARVAAERVTLSSTRGAGTVKLRLSTGALASVDLTPTSGAVVGPTVVIARSLALQPGVGTGRSGRGLAVGAGAATTVIFGRADSVAVWNSGSQAAGDVELSVARPQLSTSQPLGWGVHTGALAVGSAAQFELPAGPKRLVLTLGERTVGALAEGDTLESVHWRGGEAFEERLLSSTARLVLLREGEGQTEAPYRIEVLPLGAGENETGGELRTGKPFERAFDRTGSVRLAVEAPAGAVTWSLHVRGGDDSTTFLTEDGRVLRGPDLTPARSGVLILGHRQGMVVAWIDASGVPSDPWLASSQSSAVVPANAPGVVPLGGQSVRLRVPLGQGSVLHLRTATPVATVVTSAAGAVVEIHPAGALLHVLAEPKSAASAGGDDSVEVVLHALAGGQLAGVAELTTSPVVPLTEGLNPALLLAGGDRAYSSFELTERRRVGVGVRADASSVECELLDAAGRSLGHGVLQLVDLEPGRYTLAIGQPADAPPASARPVIVGLAAPGTGPPPEVLRTYLQELIATNGVSGGVQ
ncbi:MAG: hypothetical protein ABI609_14255 [Acidobacteriota bacterium]